MYCAVTCAALSHVLLATKLSGPDLCYLCLCYADNEAGQTTDVETSEDPSPVRRRQKTAVKDPRFTEPTQQQEQQRASRPARRAAAAVRAPVPAAAQPPASPSTEGPTFGPVFELDGVRIPVPSVWPKEMLMTKQPMAQPLSAIILRVVGPAPSIIQQPGQTSGYLQLGIGTGLAPEGQRILLTVNAKAMALRKTQPELYKEVSCLFADAVPVRANLLMVAIQHAPYMHAKLYMLSADV